MTHISESEKQNIIQSQMYFKNSTKEAEYL